MIMRLVTNGFKVPIRVPVLGGKTVVIQPGASATIPIALPNTRRLLRWSRMEKVTITELPKAPLSITGSLPLARAGSFFAYAPIVLGGSGVRRFALNKVLPDGFSFSTSTGAITGSTDTQLILSGLVITVTDATGTQTLPGLTLTVGAPAPLVATLQAAPAGTIDQTYRLPLTVTGGVGAKTYRLSNTAPPGLDVLPSTGEIAGVTSDVGNYTGVYVEVTDGAGTVVRSNTVNIVVGDVIGPASVTVARTTAPGTYLGDFVGLIGAERVQSVFPQDQRISIAGNAGVGFQVGATALVEGRYTYSFTTSLGRVFNISFRISNDLTAPTVTPVINVSLAEDQAWSLLLPTDDPTAVWSKVDDDSTDSSFFTLTGGTVSFAPKDFELPQDNNRDNVYDASFINTDPNGNASTSVVHITITNVAEAAAPQNTVAPSYTGDPKIGTEIVADPGTWMDPSGLTASVVSVTTGQAGSDYTGSTITASQGSTPYTYSVKAGTGVPGLTIDASTGRYGFSQKPTANGDFPVVLVATDADNAVFEAPSFTVTVAAAATALLVDALTLKPTTVYALRRVREGYTGPLIKVRRVDGLSVDIGYNSSNDLDTIALLDHTGRVTASAGYVEVWYDQSGGGNHAIQTTTSAQPQIVNAGAVSVANGKPCISISNNLGFPVNLPGVPVSGKRSVRSVVSQRTSSAADIFRSVNAGGWHLRAQATTRNIQLLKQGAGVIIGTTSNTAPAFPAAATIGADYDGTNLKLLLDGVETNSVNPQTLTGGGTMTIGLTATSAVTISSLYVFDSDLLGSTDTALIQSRQKAYYGTA